MKENDIYIFFEVIEQLEPQTVLDVGMILKRVGAVSRKAMNREIVKEIRLDGVDFLSEIHCLAWDNIYNEIISVESFKDMVLKQKYDCTFFLGLRSLSLKIKLSELLYSIKEYTRFVLTDQKICKWNKTNCRVIDLKVEEDNYWLYDFGE